MSANGTEIVTFFCPPSGTRLLPFPALFGIEGAAEEKVVKRAISA